MTKRSIPLWRTDFSSDKEAQQAMTQFLAKWLPLSGIGCPSGNAYNYRSYYSSSTSISMLGSAAKSVNEKNIELAADIAAEFVHLRPYWYGNYYQLLEPVRDTTSWQSYELFREDWQKGMVVLIRRITSLASKKIKLKGLIADQNYLIHDIDDKENKNDFVKSGKELMEKGINFSISMMSDIKCYEISIVLEDK